MAFGVWDLSHLYKTNDEFLADLKLLEKYLKNAKKFKNKLNTLTSEFISAIDRASLLSSDRNNIVKLSMSNEKVEISSRSQEIGSVVEKVSNYEYEGNKLDISFSAQYIIDAIKAIGSNDVELSLNGEMKPFIVKNREDDSVIQLVLPVRTYPSFNRVLSSFDLLKSLYRGFKNKGTKNVQKNEKDRCFFAPILYF